MHAPAAAVAVVELNQQPGALACPSTSSHLYPACLLALQQPVKREREQEADAGRAPRRRAGGGVLGFALSALQDVLGSDAPLEAGSGGGKVRPLAGMHAANSFVGATVLYSTANAQADAAPALRRAPTHPSLLPYLLPACFAACPLQVLGRSGSDASMQRKRRMTGDADDQSGAEEASRQQQQQQQQQPAQQRPQHQQAVQPPAPKRVALSSAGASAAAKPRAVPAPQRAAPAAAAAEEPAIPPPKSISDIRKVGLAWVGQFCAVPPLGIAMHYREDSLSDTLSVADQ